MRAVRRGIAVATLAGLAATATLALPQGGPSAASAAGCLWHKHTKKVVKKVKRHGKVRRKVRRKVWWTCDLVEAPSGAPSATGGGESGGGGDPGAGAHYLGVRAWEYDYLLSRPNVSNGALTVEFNNVGEDPHDLNIRPLGSSDAPLQIPPTASGERVTATFDLAPGTYRMWCDLEAHDALGMNATLIVDP